MNGLWTPKRVAIGVGLFVAVLLAAALIADVRKLTAALVAFPLWRLVPACGLVLVNYALRTVRFRSYLQVLGLKLGWPEAALTFVSGFLFTVTPGKMGEVAKGWLLNQRRGSSITGVATVVVAERFTDVVGLLALAAVGVAHYGAHVGLFVAVLGLCVGFLLVVAHPNLLPTLLAAAAPLGQRWTLLNKVLLTAAEVHGVLRTLTAWRPLVLGISLAAAAWLSEAIAFRILLDGVGATGGLGAAIVVYAMATLFGAVSMLPGGVGSTEAVMVALLLQPGLGLQLALPQAMLATLLIRFCTLWFGVGCGGVALTLWRRLPPYQPTAAQ